MSGNTNYSNNDLHHEKVNDFDNSILDSNTNRSKSYDSNDGNTNNPADQLKNLKLKKPKCMSIGHININSLPNKHSALMSIINSNLDILLISKQK